MNYPTHDTDWDISAKGNYWRRVDGKVLVVGRRKSDGLYWAMCDCVFLKQSFSTMEEAKRILELSLSRGNQMISAMIDELGD
jgi:hypothetical protein